MVEIQGFVDRRFQEVREEFERNFTARGDVGASVCIMVDGEEVVHLWGGEADAGTPWREDTITVTMSTTKGVTALCAHMLADRGQLDFDAPVAHYWPEFAANGKGAIPVRMLLNHQAGVPTIRRRIPEGKFLDWEYMADVIANEDLRWEPGTRFGYHTVNYGWLVGEVVRRAAGRSLGTFFREEVAEPLKLDFWIGVPDAHLQRVTPLRPDPHEEVTKLLAADPYP
jgi:CubicO group peptidase (beta-lactamase class C family)